MHGVGNYRIIEVEVPKEIGDQFFKIERLGPQEAWSLVAEFTEAGDNLFCREAKIQFLSDAAPVDLLQPGNQFELLEGRRVVARGEIVENVFNPLSATMLSQPAAILHQVAE